MPTPLTKQYWAEAYFPIAVKVIKEQPFLSVQPSAKKSKDHQDY